MTEENKINSMRLSRRGQVTVRLIQKAYANGENVEDIARRLGMEVEHIQFLTTLDALQEEKRQSDAH